MSDALAQVDHDFRQALTVLQAPPTRFYLNLTEHCSLRCQHCITQAPERTAAGTARHMTPQVLEALRPHLRHAAYVAFTHAGEPLMAPLLEPVLQALAEQRAGQPTVVHTLTNGMGLTPQRFSQLAALGVRSVSVSLDGMTPATQDALRVGSSIEVLLPRLRAVAAVRKDAHPGVRLGVAWTLTADNAAEVEDLVRFAADVGLDWVKLEEVYPINDVAHRLAQIPTGALYQTVHKAVALAQSVGLPLLEHVFEKRVFKCMLASGSSLERFSRLDDFANRMEINACQMPYQVVCVEPDGDVRPVSFHHPVAGNLLQTDLVTLWNGPVFAAERARVRDERVCQAGAVTCQADPGPENW